MCIYKILIDIKSNNSDNIDRFITDLNHLNNNELGVPENWLPAVLLNLINDNNIDKALRDKADYLLKLFMSNIKYKDFVLLGVEKHSDSRIGPKESYHIQYKAYDNSSTEIQNILSLYGIRKAILI